MWRLTQRIVRPFSSRRHRAAERRRAPDPPSPGDLARVAAELEGVARYVANLRREIAFLRGNEMFRQRLPAAQADVTGIESDVRAAVGSVLTSCEHLVAAAEAPSRLTGEAVRAEAVAIMEACCFADILAQRLGRVDAALDYTIKRLQRFALAVGIDDRQHHLDGRSREDRRCEAALLSGPRGHAEPAGQAEIDRIFAR